MIAVSTEFPKIRLTYVCFSDMSSIINIDQSIYPGMSNERCQDAFGTYLSPAQCRVSGSPFFCMVIMYYCMSLLCVLVAIGSTGKNHWENHFSQCQQTDGMP